MAELGGTRWGIFCVCLIPARVYISEKRVGMLMTIDDG